MDRLVLFAIAAVFALLTPATAQERLALLIGNSRYEHAKPLRNPENDIEVVARSLETVGFQTTSIVNAKLDDLKRSIDEFVSDVSRHERPVVLVYFAGHGVQRQGRNYLLPIDSRVTDVDELAATTLAMDDLMWGLEPVDASLKIVILDACRDDPFGDLTRGATSLQGGLAEDREASGQLIAYSTAPGRTAADGDTGTSPYASAFAETLLIPGLSLRDVFDRVREKVMERTKGGQQPWESAATYRDFHFIAPEASVEIPEIEALSWDNAVLADSAESYQRYVTRFPEGRFVALARQKIDNINKDFSFRKQSETFPVIKDHQDALDFCSTRPGTASNSHAFDVLAELYKFTNELVYVDIHIPLSSLMCPKGGRSMKLEAVSQDPDNCFGILYHFSDEIAETRHVADCVASPEWAPRDWGAYLGRNNGLIVDQYGEEALYLSAENTPYYQYLFDPQEGMFEEAFVVVKGLVRVHTFIQEVFISYFLEPVDPSELGLSWKYQNTLEAYRKGAGQTGMQIIELGAGLSAEAGTAGETSTDAAATQWDHNGSTMALSGSGGRVVFSYLKPREALLSSGITSGTPLFEGTSPDGQTYSGTAYTFSRICGSLPYAVSGSLSSDGSRVVLSGRAPRLNAECRLTGTRQDTLVFLLIDAAGAADRSPSATAPRQPLVFSSFWSHNGSLMGLARDGESRTLAYVTPRETIKSLGIDYGTVLFEGTTRDGRNYSGQARTFSSNCTSQTYRVRGTVSANDRRIVLEGLAPKLDATCRQTGTRSETMVFDLVR